MMFNKFMLLLPEDVNPRNIKEIYPLILHMDISKSLIFSEGILDVLDHTTPTTGYGSKLAIDLTSVEVNNDITILLPPKTTKPVGGIAACDSSLFAMTKLIILFAEKDNFGEVDVMRYIKENHIPPSKYIVIFDHNAMEGMSHSDLLWLAAANTDPKRDITIENNMVIVDARSKAPDVGRNPKRFPNIVTSSLETIELVDSRWQEYGLGKRIESPSRVYHKLRLSDDAQW